MARISVLGGTGYAGSNIAQALLAQGHQVTSYARSAPNNPIDGIDYVTGSLLEDSTLDAALADVDVVIAAISPRGSMAGHTRALLAKVADRAQAAGIRFGVSGGAGSLRVAEGGALLSETDGFPDEFKPEASEMAGVLDDLSNRHDSLDWFYVSPAAGFGAWVPGEATGEFRVGADVLLVDAEGNSNIGGADFGTAVANEVTHPAHHRSRFTIAY